MYYDLYTCSLASSVSLRYSLAADFTAVRSTVRYTQVSSASLKRQDTRAEAHLDRRSTRAFASRSTERRYAQSRTFTFPFDEVWITYVRSPGSSLIGCQLLQLYLPISNLIERLESVTFHFQCKPSSAQRCSAAIFASIPVHRRSHFCTRLRDVPYDCSMYEEGR